jgi:hypothetical protein
MLHGCATNKRNCISIANLPCGNGKTMAWLLYTAATLEFGGEQNVLNEIAPYKFLSQYQYTTTQKKLIIV